MVSRRRGDRTIPDFDRRFQVEPMGVRRVLRGHRLKVSVEECGHVLDAKDYRHVIEQYGSARVRVQSSVTWPNSRSNPSITPCAWWGRSRRLAASALGSCAGWYGTACRADGGSRSSTSRRAHVISVAGIVIASRRGNSIALRWDMVLGP